VYWWRGMDVIAKATSQLVDSEKMDKTCPHTALVKNGDYWTCQKCQKQLDKRTVVELLLAKTYRQSEETASLGRQSQRLAS